jgi:hypothetical protein
MDRWIIGRVIERGEEKNVYFSFVYSANYMIYLYKGIDYGVWGIDYGVWGIDYGKVLSYPIPKSSW